MGVKLSHKLRTVHFSQCLRVSLECAQPRLSGRRVIFPVLLKLAAAMPCAQVQDRLGPGTDHRIPDCFSLC